MNHARIQYVNNDKREGYEIMILTDEGEWGLECFFPLVQRIGADHDEERNFVHFGILNKIAQLKVLGYEIDFNGMVI